MTAQIKPTPPAPKPKRPKPTADVVLVLLQGNLEAMRAWYHAANMPGQEVGYNVMAELVLADVSIALEYALRGEAWVEPTARKG